MASHSSVRRLGSSNREEILWDDQEEESADGIGGGLGGSGVLGLMVAVVEEQLPLQ